MEQRKILHIDMDAFFASVEQRDDPNLKGKPIAVGGSSERGVVAAASYEARKFGIFSAMPGKIARRKCPQLIFVRPNFEKYKQASRHVFAIFKEVTDMIEGLSLDEAYLDVTNNHWNEPSATRIAERIKETIVRELQLTASAGVASSKSVAKIASGYEKPNGITVVPPDRTMEFLRPQLIRKIPGVGPKTAERLQAMSIWRIGDIEKMEKEELISILGKQGGHIWRLANGIDLRAVSPHRERKSQSAERTFASDILNIEEIETTILHLIERVSFALQRVDFVGRTITLKIRYADFSTRTHSKTMASGTSNPESIFKSVQALLLHTNAGQIPVRLIGVGLSNLIPRMENRQRYPIQLNLPFPD